MLPIHFAPVQGHTDAAYRHLHAELYPESVCQYYTPFIRLEKDGIRRRDLNDILSPFNGNHKDVPQIIFRDSKELNALVDILQSEKIDRIDLNLGCPFPPQNSKGRGAAAVANPEVGAAIEKIVNENPGICFSVKMRLGFKDENDWECLLPYLNRTNLKHITLHPRIAKEQYSGDLHMDVFREFLDKSTNPVIFNGEIKSPEDIANLENEFPGLAGIMIGRGILARPSLAMEYISQKESDRATRLRIMLDFHRKLLQHYSDTLEGGEHQVLSKIQPFWEYAQDEIGRKAWKAIKKSTNMAKYHTAVAMI